MQSSPVLPPRPSDYRVYGKGKTAWSPTVIRFHDSRLSEKDARALLQMLRDLNLGACAIDVTRLERIRLEGCLSLDAPVERGVRYLLRRSDGRAEVLSVTFQDGRLRLAREDEVPRTGRKPREVGADVFSDRFGRVAVPELGARIDLVNNAPRELEHFLRRLVRASFVGGAMRRESR